MKHYLNKTLAILLTAFILTACGTSTAPTQDVNAIMTSGVSSMVASFFETQTAMVTPATLTPVPSITPLPSPTIDFPTATFPPPPTATYIFYTSTPGLANSPTATFGTPGTAVTVNPTLLAAGCNNMIFIRDVTVPAGTVVKPNEDFVKTWKVQNTGTCPWLYQYSLISVSGGDFGAGQIKLQKMVQVDDWSELSAPLTAPRSPGTYVSYWRLADADGKMFGATLVVSFVVAE